MTNMKQVTVGTRVGVYQWTSTPTSTQCNPGSFIFCV